MLTYVYPLFGLFWTMVTLVVLVIWIMLLFRVLADVFRSQDLGGFAKALWLLFVMFVPLLGVLVYLIARGGATAQRHQQAQARYIRDAADPASAAAEIDKLARLAAQGALTDAEFEAQKAKFLS